VNINSMAPTSRLLGAASPSLMTPPMRGDSSAGEFLTKSDIAMIKAATNTDFNWPPAIGEGAPQAAFDLNMLRLRQMQQGSVIADFTAQDLSSLRRSGLIDSGFLSNALDYLSKPGQHRENSQGASSTAPRQDLTHKVGTVTMDGYMFL
jgi:hypothetical protein